MANAEWEARMVKKAAEQRRLEADQAVIDRIMALGE
jgi:hypothetical protein